MATRIKLTKRHTSTQTHTNAKHVQHTSTCKRTQAYTHTNIDTQIEHTHTKKQMSEAKIYNFDIRDRDNINQRWQEFTFKLDK